MHRNYPSALLAALFSTCCVFGADGVESVHSAEALPSFTRGVGVLRAAAGNPGRRRPQGSPLSSFERYVLQLVAIGMTNAEIADELNLHYPQRDEFTIDKVGGILGSIYPKLGLEEGRRRREHAVWTALNNGWITVTDPSWGPLELPSHIHLSDLEWRLIQGIGAGLNESEIALLIGVSRRQQAALRAELFEKLDVHGENAATLALTRVIELGARLPDNSTVQLAARSRRSGFAVAEAILLRGLHAGQTVRRIAASAHAQAINVTEEILRRVLDGLRARYGANDDEALVTEVQKRRPDLFK